MNFYDIAVWILRFLVYLINGKPVVRGTEHIPQDQLFIMVSTHRSLLDPVFLAIIFHNEGQRLAFMAKQQLFHFKTAGIYSKKGMVFPVDREQASTSTIRHAVKVT